MEKPAQPVEEPESTESNAADASPKRRRFTLAINQTVQEWILRRNLSENDSFYKEESSEEDDDDTEEDSDAKEKTHKVRKFFKALFTSHVSREPIAAEKPGKPALQEEVSISVGPESVALSADAVAEGVVTSTAEQQQQPEETEESQQTVAAEPAVEQPSARIESPLDPIVAARFEQAHREAGIVPQSQEETVEVPLRSGPRVADEFRPVAEKTFKAEEQRNYLRNRKRKREITESNQRIKKLEKIQKEGEQPNVVEVTTEVIPKPRASSERLIPQLPVEKIVEKRIPAEQEPQSVKEILAKRRIERVQETTMKPQELPRAQYEAMRPEAVQEQVEKAAEEDIAIEGMFERSHETKDVDSGTNTAGSSGGTAPVRQVATPVTAKATAPSVTPTITPRAESNPPIVKEEYKQAARHGFWAAIVLLIFIAMLAFIR